MNKLLHVFSIIDTPIAFFDGQFKMMVDAGYDVHLVTGHSDMGYAFAERNNITYKPMVVSRSMSPGSDLKTIRQLVKYIKKEKFDAVFGHTPKGALVSMTAAWLCGVKNRVYYRHGLIYVTARGVKRLVLKLEERFVSLLATDIVNVSNSLGEFALADRLNSAKKQHVIGKGTCGGIDAGRLFNPETLEPRKVAALREFLGLENAFVLGFCGRICNDKGIPELVSAFEMFKERHPEMKAKLLLVGVFDSRDSVSDSVHEAMDSDSDIVLTGMIEKHNLPYYYSVMDVYMFPSHREGFGMSPLEASAMEKPALVSNVVGCANTIIEGRTGFYLPLDSEGICEAMEKMTDAPLRSALGKNGRQWVLANYDFSILWPQVIDLYKKILR